MMNMTIDDRKGNEKMKRTVIEILPSDTCIQIARIVNNDQSLIFDRDKILFYLPLEIFGTTQTLMAMDKNGFIIVHNHERYFVPTYFTRVIYDVRF